jgi:hypothetical protein
MSLAEIQQLLEQWRRQTPKVWGEPRPRARSPQVTNRVATASSVPNSGRRYRKLDLAEKVFFR